VYVCCVVSSSEPNRDARVDEALLFVSFELPSRRRAHSTLVRVVVRRVANVWLYLTFELLHACLALGTGSAVNNTVPSRPNTQHMDWPKRRYSHTMHES